MEIVQRIISTPFVSFFDSNLHMLSRPGETTINAQYVIEPNQNGGVNYQYDVVVKNRNERRRLDAGDCECYREVNTEVLFISFCCYICVKFTVLRWGRASS